MVTSSINMTKLDIDIILYVMLVAVSVTMYGNFQLMFGIIVSLFKLNEENCYGTGVYNFDKYF